ncbi:MAG TPA: hypothetical protein VNT81_04605 [Vicinamibacterales bacterium]|nr:hypothetical protein [Vicinamibacterales bacterium]
MIRSVTTRCFAVFAVVFAAACGGGETATPAPAAAPAPAPAAAAEAPKAPATLTLLEPNEGAMGGHIDMFRWSPVAGADGYVIKIVAVTGDRTVWESAPLTVTETKLPATVALEPEVHTWTVTARKGSEVLATAGPQRFTITP